MQLARRIDLPWRDQLLDRTDLNGQREALPSQLSGGEAARAGLAVALAARPAVLLADEPTGEVDAATEKRILTLVADHCRSGGGPYWSPTASGWRPGRRGNCTCKTAGSSMAEPLVRACQIGRSYFQGGALVHALVSASCEVGAGARIAILGPSGSGKSTLLHILGGVESRARARSPGPPWVIPRIFGRGDCLRVPDAEPRADLDGGRECRAATSARRSGACPARDSTRRSRATGCR